MQGEEYLEVKFRLHDGTDIGPGRYLSATTVATLKESVLAQWPKEKENGPRTINDVKLINAGKILENNKTLGECRGPICDLPGGVITMLVVLRPPSAEKGNEKQPSDTPRDGKCMCIIL